MPELIERLAPPLIGGPCALDEASSRGVFDVAVGETLDVGNNITVTVLSKSGRQAKLLVCAPRSMPVKRTVGRT